MATAFALAVTYPPAGNIGGGGYLLVVPDQGAGSTVFDFREVAPAAATREMFVDPAGARRIAAWACRARCGDWRWHTGALDDCRGASW